MTATFQQDTARMNFEDGADGRGDLEDVLFRRVGTCPA